MQHFIDLLKEHQPYTRYVWYLLGLIGLYIFKQTRPLFYENKSWLFWICTYAMYMVLGPGVFVLSLITLFNFNKKK